MELSTKLVRDEGVVFRVIEEDGIIYNPSTKRLHILNKTALIAWSLWDGNHSLEDIGKAIMSEYEAELDEVMKDVVACANELCRYGLLNDASS